MTLSLSAYHLRPDTIREYNDRLLRFQPRYLKGYSGATYLLASLLSEHDLTPPVLAAVFTTSEHLPLAQRATIERVFKCPVFDYYGCVEVNSVGYECMHHAGYHIPEEHVVVEAVPLPDEDVMGQKLGAFVLTDLDNYYMPLIRYRNGDAGEISAALCACGRTLWRISRLCGRISDLLRSTAGHLIDGGIVDYVMGTIDGVREYRLVQETERRCHLRYIAEPTFAGELCIETHLKSFLGTDMSIVMERVASLPLTASGKRRFTVSQLSLSPPLA